MDDKLDPVEKRRDEDFAEALGEQEELGTDAIFMVWLPKPGDKPRYRSATLYSREALRSLFLGVLANDAFPPGYELFCSADDKNAKHFSSVSLLGTAIYRKRGGRLWTLMATGPFEGLLERLFPSYQQQEVPQGETVGE